MSASTKVARRYAKAVMSLCDERGDGEVVRTALDTLAAVLTQVPQALQFLSNPTMPFDERRNLLVQLLDATAVQGTARNVVLLLLDKGRIAEILRVREEFSTLLDLKTGRVEAQVSSAVELSAAARERVQVLLGRLLGKEVVLMARVDPALIGGVVVRIGNTVWDGSVANHLNRLRQQLIAE